MYKIVSNSLFFFILASYAFLTTFWNMLVLKVLNEKQEPQFESRMKCICIYLRNICIYRVFQFLYDKQDSLLGKDRMFLRKIQKESLRSTNFQSKHFDVFSNLGGVWYKYNRQKWLLACGCRGTKRFYIILSSLILLFFSVETFTFVLCVKTNKTFEFPAKEHFNVLSIFQKNAVTYLSVQIITYQKLRENYITLENTEKIITKV